MIQANELRIGNWVVRNGINYQIVKGFEIDSASDGLFPFSPIPLTPEILEKAGFRQYNNSYYEVSHQTQYGERTHIMLSIEFQKCLIGIIRMEYCLYPKHIHQLQNLYFALTGEELKLDL